MKNRIGTLIACMALVFVSCKKENVSTIYEPSAYESLLEGNWNLDAVSYDATNPIIPLPIKGEAGNVNGTLKLTLNPNQGVFDFSFTVDALGAPLPINQKIEGSWTVVNNDSQINLVDNATGETLEMVVLVNQEKKQKFETVYTTTIQGFSLDVNLILEFSRP